MKNQLFLFLLKNNYLNIKKIITDNYHNFELSQRETLLILEIISNFKTNNLINKDFLIKKTKFSEFEIESILNSLIFKKEIISFLKIANSKQILFNFEPLVKKILNFLSARFNPKKIDLNKINVISEPIPFKTIKINKTLNEISEQAKKKPLIVDFETDFEDTEFNNNQFEDQLKSNVISTKRIFEIIQNLIKNENNYFEHLEKIFKNLSLKEKNNIVNNLKKLQKILKNNVNKNVNNEKINAILFKINNVIDKFEDLTNNNNINYIFNDNIDYGFFLKNCIKELPVEIYEKLKLLQKTSEFKTEFLNLFKKIQVFKRNDKYSDKEKDYEMSKQFIALNTMLYKYKFRDQFKMFEIDNIIEKMFDYVH